MLKRIPDPVMANKGQSCRMRLESRKRHRNTDMDARVVRRLMHSGSLKTLLRSGLSSRAFAISRAPYKGMAKEAAGTNKETKADANLRHANIPGPRNRAT